MWQIKHKFQCLILIVYENMGNGDVYYLQMFLEHDQTHEMSVL